MKKISFVLLVLAVSLVFAQAQNTNKVKSKKGDIDLVSTAGGSEVVCTANFYDEMDIMKRQDSHVLVKGSCGQGWVNVVDIERVVENKYHMLDYIDVTGWIHDGPWLDPSAVFVICTDEYYLLEGIDISRHFGDYLKNTLDREQIERYNKEIWP